MKVHVHAVFNLTYKVHCMAMGYNTNAMMTALTVNRTVPYSSTTLKTRERLYTCIGQINYHCATNLELSHNEWHEL